MDIAATPQAPAPLTIHREDYRPPDWLVPEVALDFALGIDETRVTASLKVRRNPDGQRQRRPSASTATASPRWRSGSMAGQSTTGGWRATIC